MILVRSRRKAVLRILIPILSFAFTFVAGCWGTQHPRLAARDLQAVEELEQQAAQIEARIRDDGNE